MIHIHDLDGCAPAPLAHYLKALGILRLVSEQADPQARGWWQGDRFRLATRLDRERFERFFLEHYKPTPVFNPWGARSGFYAGSSEASSRAALAVIEKSDSPRLVPFRHAIAVVRRVLVDTTQGLKPEDKEEQQRLLLGLRREVRGPALLWLDAVSAVLNDSMIAFPALFGTGGSEGSGSYTFTYMKAVELCLVQRAWDHALPVVLFRRDNIRDSEWSQPFGQYDPAGASTPWDVLLAFEGACLLRSAVTSRSESSGTKWLSSPFFVAPASYAYSSGSEQDEYIINKGKQLPGRGEQWFPMWGAPLRHTELSTLLQEGRAVTRRSRAQDGWSMARAIATLGVGQGIREFARYGYQQRNNLATHFAVPLGRFRVPDRIEPHLVCLDDLDAWLPRLRRAARAKTAPGRLRHVERALGDALFAVTQHPREPARWQTVLLALADVEAVMVTGSGYRAGPIPMLRPEWVTAAHDGADPVSARELRLALSFALQRWRDRRSDSEPVMPDTVRRHWLPLKAGGYAFATSGSGSQMKLSVRPEMVMAGRNGEDDAIALLTRRLVEASQRGDRRLPLVAAPRTAANRSDLAAVTGGQVSLDRTLQLARALLALNPYQWRQQPRHLSAPCDDDWPDDAWMTIRLALLPWPLDDGRRIAVDPAIVRRLGASDAATAFNLALRRLHAAGIRSSVRMATAPASARLWTAALAFPISRRTAARFIARVDPS